MSRRPSILRRLLPAAAAALLATLSACGSESPSDLAGSYGVDVEATAAAAAGPGQKPTDAHREAVKSLLGTQVRAAEVVLELGSDGRYRLFTGAGTGASTVEGRWERTAAGVRTMPERVDGGALPLDARQGDDYRLEGGLLVLPWPNGELYFRRR